MRVLHVSVSVSVPVSVFVSVPVSAPVTAAVVVCELRLCLTVAVLCCRGTVVQAYYPPVSGGAC